MLPNWTFSLKLFLVVTISAYFPVILFMGLYSPKTLPKPASNTTLNNIKHAHIVTCTYSIIKLECFTVQ